METVGGFRLVRKLGEGRRAEVWLGHAGRSDDRMAAIKVFRPHTSIDSIDVEIEALTRVASPHLLGLDDVATAPDGLPCLIFRRLGGLSLARLVVDRPLLEGGEIVTALAPIIGAISALHDVGVGHGAIGLPAILFDQRGAPVLARFGSARVVARQSDDSAVTLTAAEREREPALRADLDRLSTLLLSLVGRLEPSRGGSELMDWIETSERDDRFLGELSERVFELAEPIPIALGTSKVGTTPPSVGDGQRGANGSGERLRSLTIESVDGEGHPVLREGRRQDVESTGRSALSTLADLMDSGDHHPLQSLVGMVRRALGTVRRPVWIAGAAGLVAVAIAVVIVSSAGSAGTHDVASSTASTAPSSTAPSSTATAAPNPEATRSGPAGSDAALDEDDPLAAAIALLDRRTACVDARSTGCLSRIEQADSAALEADRYFLRQLQGGGTVKDRRFDPATAIIERLGDSALIGLGSAGPSGAYPQTALLVKVDGRWTIRDLTAEP